MQRIRSGAAIGLGLIIFAVAALATPAASAPTGLSNDEQILLTKTNDLRVSLGVPALQIDAEVQALAEEWSQHMANGAGLVDRQDQWAGITTPVYRVGDAIAQDWSVDGVFQQFASNPAHRASLTDPRYDYVGIGVTVATNGAYWVQIKFIATLPPGDAPAASDERTADTPPPAEPTAPVVPPTEVLPTDVVVLGETLTKGVNQAVIPPIRYGALGLPPATVAPSTSSHGPVIALGIGIGLLLLVMAALVFGWRRRAAKP